MQQRLRKWIVRAAIAFSGFLGVGTAGAELVNFETDPLGILPVGWMSWDSSGVFFSASPGGELQVMPEVGSSEFLGTRGLAVFGTPDVSLLMDFNSPVSSLQLSFGNDDAAFTSAGDQAVLSVFLADAFVQSVSVPLNRNDWMDQTIAISGTRFDRAVFFYTADRFLAETVDDISFLIAEGPPPAVPEPASALLLALGLAWVLRKRILAGGGRNGGAQA
jgi:hypothetical protein